MTGIQIKGRSFRGALRYNLEKVDKGVAEVLDHSFVGLNEKLIMKEVQFVRMNRPNLRKYFYHTSVNIPPAEDISNNLMKQIGLDYLLENGFDQHQFIMFRHYDADHPHLHILVNRIGYDGRVLTDSNDYARSEKALRKLEIKYNLTQVLSSRQSRERSMTKNELEMMKRTNEPSNKMKLQVILKEVVISPTKLDTGTFIKRLEENGVNVHFNQASTGYVSGISYGFDGIIIKGAKLGNDFKWSSIKSKIRYEQERDRTTIHEANVRSRAAGSTDINRGAQVSNRPADREDRKDRKRTQPQPAPQFRKISGGSNPGQQGIGNQAQTGDRTGKGHFSKAEPGLHLESLLDSHRRGDHRLTDNQPDLDIEKLSSRRKRKRKRRGRSL